MLRISLILFFISLGHFGFGQGQGFKSEKLAFADTLTIDSLSLVPGSVIIFDDNGEIISDTLFQINPAYSRLFFNSAISTDSVLVHYRTLALDLDKKYFIHDLSELEPSIEKRMNPFLLPENRKQETFVDFGTIKSSGEISRGITVGNSQNLAVNSNLNLQLSGPLTDKIELTAVISDNNLPIQPDGNTAQIQEFDNVFIKLNDDKNALIAGDYNIDQSDGYFMKFHKRVKGVAVESTVRDNDNETLNVEAGIAVAKGKLTRKTFEGIENKQGPYRLTGENNELFVIILAGTEKVYVDGRLLFRGQENDYTVDYNSAEIRFTPNQLITQNHRIVVEYEYSDKNYSRSLLASKIEYTRDKLSLNINAYNEQDGKNKSLQQDISLEDRAFLASLGDSIQNAVVNSEREVPYSNQEILYRKIDTAGLQGIFQRSTTSTDTVSRVSFSLVGQGNGHYRKAQSTGNGRVFEFVAPVNGVPQGDYAPVSKLITPKKNQLVTLGGGYQFSKRTHLSFEIARSVKDINTFSSLDNQDDEGIAAFLSLKNENPISENWYLGEELSVEIKEAQFIPLEQYRPVEFTRDFNINSLKSLQQERLGGLGLSLSNKKNSFSNYKISGLKRGADYKGIQQKFSTKNKLGSWQLNYSGSYLSSSSQTINTVFFRQYPEISKKFSLFTIGTGLREENNKISSTLSDSLQLNSFGFQEIYSFIENPDSAKNRHRLEVTRRNDNLVEGNVFKPSTQSDDIGFASSFLKNPKQTLRLKASYRNLRVINPIRNQSGSKAILGRAEYNPIFGKGFLTGSTYFEVSSGQEEKREFVYLEVPAGQGAFIFIDRNGNGIQEIDEFEIPPFANEANFIRIFTPTNEFINSQSSDFNQSVFINPSATIKASRGLNNFLRAFSNQTSIALNKKTSVAPSVEAFNPFTIPLEDTTLITANSQVQSTFFILRNNYRYGGQLGYLGNENKSQLVNGIDILSRERLSGQARSIVGKSTEAVLSVYGEEKTFNSQFLVNRNYALTSQSVKPEIIVQIKTNLRVNLSYAFTEKTNAQEFGGEQNTNQAISAKASYNDIGRGVFSGEITFLKNDYLGESNSAVSYEILEGLQKGNNITWQLNIQRDLGNGLQLNLNYNGRKSELIPTIHTGTVQVNAYF